MKTLKRIKRIVDDSDFPDMPKDFWNYSYNPVSGHITQKGKKRLNRDERV